MKPFKTAHSQFVVLILSISLLLAACGSFSTGTPPPNTAAPIVDVSALPWLQIYFTDPTAPYAHDYEGGPDQALANAIDGARLSVDVAIYSLDLQSIRDALIHASQRGVVVRIVMESDNMDDSEVQDLKDAGIPLIGDKQEGLMHDKFAVIDRSDVWTGSMNYTVSSAYKDNNNLICIHSKQVAEDYTNEFEEMFTNNLFGPEKATKTPYSKLIISGTPMEVYFSPEDHVVNRIVGLISGAQESIEFMAYSFTSNDIGSAMVGQAQAGIKVTGVMDADQVKSNQGTEYDPFIKAGLDVRLDGNNGLMDHKVIIIDQKIVITGSYDFTARSEDNNDENVVIISSPGVAAKYLEEFQKVYAQAQQP